jgi:hypothetical protein
LWATDMQGVVVYDNIERAATLDIQPANIYQSGRDIDSRCGIVFFPKKRNVSGTRSASSESATQRPGECEPLPK